MRWVLFFCSGLFVFPFVLFAHEVPGVATIHIYDDRYEPMEVTITQEEAVIFENFGKTDHWPASNIHPTHGIYPEFDAGPVEPGASWQFDFTRAGVWRFHDHLFPEMTGTIMAQEDAAATTTEATEQKKHVSFLKKVEIVFFRAWYTLFPKAAERSLARINTHETARDEERTWFLLSIFGAKAIMNDLLADTDGGSMADCHQEAHRIGRIAYELYGAEVFKEGDPSCHSGFYHGAMEELLAIEGTENLAESIDRICSSFPTSFGIFECLHGVGHGVLAYVDYVLPQALKECQRLKTPFDQSSCYGGMFMENIVTGQGSGAKEAHATKWVRQDDYHFPCTVIQDNPSALFECYQMQTSWMLTIAGYDFERVAKECTKSVAGMQETCFRSLGRDAARYALRDPGQIIALCAAAERQGPYLDECILGALHVIVDFWGEKLGRQTADLCDRVTSGTIKNTCYESLAARLSGLFTNEDGQTRICATFDPEYQYLCRKQ